MVWSTRGVVQSVVEDTRVRWSGGRALLLVSGVVLVASAAWFGASWIDTSRGDQTCGSVLRPALWLGAGAPACRNVMTVRAVVAGCMLGLAVALFVRSGRRRPIGRGWLAAAVVGLVGSGAVLLVNESVRSMGAL